MYELTELEKKFIEISSNCERYLPEYTSRVLSLAEETVISKGALYNLRPYEMERAGFKKGRRLNKLPANIKNTHVYYFDEAKRILSIDIYGQSENIINKEFCLYGDDYLERMYFTSTGLLRNISVSFFDGAIFKKDINWGAYGCSVSDYIYSDSILEKIVVHQKEHDDPSFSIFDVVFKYKGDDLETIENIFPNGYREQRFP